MTTRPSLVRSIPFWVLIVGSLATFAFGAWLLLGKLGTMTVALTAQTATGVDVYVGQVVAIIGGILIATGLIGLGLALVLGVVRSLVAQPVVEVVEPAEWVEDEPVAVAPVAPVVTETAAQPVDNADTVDALETADVAVPAEPALTKQPASTDR